MKDDLIVMGHKAITQMQKNVLWKEITLVLKDFAFLYH